MPPLQIASLCFALLGPILLYLVQRQFPSPRFDQVWSRILAAILALSFLTNLLQIFATTTSPPLALILPMQLCDWASIAVLVALLNRSQTAFEIAYFWGLAGTSQALITPAIDVHSPWLTQIAFWGEHATIVASILFLLLISKFRPRSFLPIFLWSQIYFSFTIFINYLANANYGFLSHPPSQPSLLDLFSHNPWLYRLEINAIGISLFFILYLPWILTAHRSPGPTTSL
ncbi:MAG: TIGR02206 family membrane protein, partial [Verrucomicrobiota bacterium]